ncbi:acyltransferase domain-containing protein [Nocardia sp. NPDC051570]|uniref:acyltransferase domain-containing protein n=1 Tax=Nocardia sp. NPDC051570 TaxID=3364324 RepID=UPI0037959DAC
MGAALRAEFPVFQRTFDDLIAQLDVGLEEVLLGSRPDDRVHHTLFAQTGLFVYEVALFRLLESWGLRPDYVAGHSIGEIAAAHVAGVLSVADACALVAARGRLMQALPGTGAMVAIAASEAEVAPLLSAGVGVAAINGPRSVVISGDEDEVLRVASHFEKTKRLTVSHAFHSPLMEPMLGDFAEIAAGLTYHEPRIPLISNVSGGPAGIELFGDPDYWVRHVREPVRFGSGVRSLVAAGVTRFVELGPASVLTVIAQENVESTATFVALGQARVAETTALMTGLAHAYLDGLAPNWAAVYPGRRRVSLPTYAFTRRRFWIGSDPAVGGTGIPVRTTPVEVPAPIEADQLRRRIVEATPALRNELLLELVREKTAWVLGHDTVAAVNASVGFLEAGMDSAVAIELRNALEAALTVSLSAGVVFDHATPNELAAHLDTVVRSDGGTVVDDEGSVSALLRRAAADGDMMKGMALLRSVAEILPSFSSRAELGALADPVRLSSGTAGPMLICFASPMALGGAQQYARFAAHWRGRRDVVAVPIPGFGAGEALPTSVAAAVAVFVDSVRAIAADAPFVLVGYSSGGQFAHATAVALEKEGRPATAVVLLDTYLPDLEKNNDSREPLWHAMFAGMLDRESSFGRFSAARLAAMSRYSDLIVDCQPSAVHSPVLFVRAGESFVPDLADADWQASWPDDHVLREVPGTHFTLLEDAASATAAIIDDWLSE